MIIVKDDSAGSADRSSSSSDSSSTSSESVVDPISLICKEDVGIALMVEQGPDAVVRSFFVDYFDTEPVAHKCTLLRVRVAYKNYGKLRATHYVVKTSCPTAATAQNCSKYARKLVEKEARFYNEIVPLLDFELDAVDEKPLRVPQLFYNTERSSHLLLYLEDLRRCGYKRLDPMNGMDKYHTELVLAELARLHTASVLLMSDRNYQREDMMNTFPALKEYLIKVDEENREIEDSGPLPYHMSSCAEIARRCNGFQAVSRYLEDNLNKRHEIFKAQLEQDERFTVICHGDSWSNHFLFRYSRDGAVEECRLLDFQGVRLGSVALDLNYMLFSSLTGETRRNENTAFMSHYYAHFTSAMAAGGIAGKFSLSQFKTECRKKSSFGHLMALMKIHHLIIESDGAPQFELFAGGLIDNLEAVSLNQEAIVVQAFKYPLLELRLLPIFQHMLENINSKE